MAIRLPAVSSFTARVCFVPEFLIAWASSRIASRQRCRLHPVGADEHAIRGDDQVERDRHRRATEPRRLSHSTSEGWATAKHKRGGKPRQLRSSSFAISDAGTTSRLAAFCLTIAFEVEQKRNHLDRLAEAHIVGQTSPPTPAATTNFSQCVARLLVRVEVALSAPAGTSFVSGLGRAQSLRGSRSRSGPAVRPDHSRMAALAFCPRLRG